MTTSGGRFISGGGRSYSGRSAGRGAGRGAEALGRKSSRSDGSGAPACRGLASAASVRLLFARAALQEASDNSRVPGCGTVPLKSFIHHFQLLWRRFFCSNEISISKLRVGLVSFMVLSAARCSSHALCFFYIDKSVWVQKHKSMRFSEPLPFFLVWAPYLHIAGAPSTDGDLLPNQPET